jgi:phage tail sheath protein FI
MPVTPPISYPGVYIEELQSGVRTIVGVPTSITAFLGRASRGPVDEPVTVTNFGDYERTFGGLNLNSTMSYAVRDFFLNGGGQAIIVRLQNNAVKARNADLNLEAISEGEWGNNIAYTVDVNGITDEVVKRYKDLTRDDLFNLSIFDIEKGNVEKFLNVTVKSNGSPRHLDRVLEAESSLVRAQMNQGSPVPVRSKPTVSKPEEDPSPSNPKKDPAQYKKFAGGVDSQALTDQDIIGDPDQKTGIYALEKADLFNILCIPPDIRGGDVSPQVLAAALTYCVKRRAILIVDPLKAWAEPKENAAAQAKAGVDALGISGENARNAMLYFPRVVQADLLRESQPDVFPACGIIAGIMARTDATRGVWKAPAGLDATLTGIRGLQASLTDAENGQLNPLAINCLRTFPTIGTVLWGARTMRGTDPLADDYKYLPVRRLALYIEETLYRSTKWAVFEPNDEPLWSQLRLNIGTFMLDLFRQGAFQGQKPSDAYFVRCDSSTTSQSDIDKGIVNILVGFAPLKPAEFVVIYLQQMAGNLAA